MKDSQTLPKPTGSSELSTWAKMSRLSTSTVTNRQMWAIQEGHDLGQGSFLWLRQCLTGPRLEAVSSAAGSWATHPSLKGVVGSVSPSLGCWGNTVRTESNLLCRFFGDFINILRSAVITGEAQGKISTKMWAC